jgi:hypothetical protein
VDSGDVVGTPRLIGRVVVAVIAHSICKPVVIVGIVNCVAVHVSTRLGLGGVIDPGVVGLGLIWVTTKDHEFIAVIHCLVEFQIVGCEVDFTVLLVRTVVGAVVELAG